jgi:hypothetical protein
MGREVKGVRCGDAGNGKGKSGRENDQMAKTADALCPAYDHSIFDGVTDVSMNQGIGGAQMNSARG